MFRHIGHIRLLFFLLCTRYCMINHMGRGCFQRDLAFLGWNLVTSMSAAAVFFLPAAVVHSWFSFLPRETSCPIGPPQTPFSAVNTRLLRRSRVSETWGRRIAVPRQPFQDNILVHGKSPGGAAGGVKKVRENFQEILIEILCDSHV